MSSCRFLFQLWKKVPTRPEIVILSSILSITTVSAAKLKQENVHFCQPSFNPLIKPEVIQDIRSCTYLRLIFLLNFRVKIVFGTLNRTLWNFVDYPKRKALDSSRTFWNLLDQYYFCILEIVYEHWFSVSNFISEKYDDDNGGSIEEKNDRMVFRSR